MNNTCYLAFITQAICANFAPLLFLRFHTNYGISLGQIALIPTAFFLTRFMIGSGILCLCCYLLASLSASPVLGLIGCIFCGFSVGIMWPGTISITSLRLPRGGTALFALLAMAGDLGGAFGPSLVGAVTQQAGDDLRSGILVGSIFPLILIISLFLMDRKKT